MGENGYLRPPRQPRYALRLADEIQRRGLQELDKVSDLFAGLVQPGYVCARQRHPVRATTMATAVTREHSRLHGGSSDALGAIRGSAAHIRVVATLTPSELNEAIFARSGQRIELIVFILVVQGYSVL